MLPTFDLLAQVSGLATGIAVVIAVLLIVLAIASVIVAQYFRYWVQSYLTGAGITLWDLIGMTFRKVNIGVIVKSKIIAVQAGLNDPEITSQALEAHYLANGNVALVIQALVAANKAKSIQLSFREATAIDLAGRNVLETVQTSVYPKVIDCPPKGRGVSMLEAVARNGIQLKAKVRVTVRADLQKLIGGASEETIIARVGEGIVSAIGSADDHLSVLENPDYISKAVLARRLDAQTAFEIISIDIAEMNVGENIGARLRADGADAASRAARANAEGRRAMAVAAEQEQLARIEESRAKLVAAEAEVPQAMADAFWSGRLRIMNYYELQNVQADTEMRESLARCYGVEALGRK
jgi:uncharacterized protein YqfA (UPF0365 family)